VEEPDWAGLYIGAHVGHGSGEREGCYGFTSDTCNTDFHYDQDGWLAGAQLGYNLMASPNIVLGAEVDASLAGIDGELDLANDKVGVGEYEWLASAKVRAGWATDDLLLYATGGLALAGFDYEDEWGCEFSQTRSGLLLGGGAELKITGRASVKAEYNFIDFGDESENCSIAFGPITLPQYNEAEAELHVIKVGSNYLIGGP
jgi:outer membrane immunogenic protein